MIRRFFLVAFLGVFSFSILGCSTPPPADPKPTVIVEYKYVTTPIPSAILEIPAPIPDLDIENVSNTDIAKWMLSSEERTIELETKLKKISELNKGKSE